MGRDLRNAAKERRHGSVQREHQREIARAVQQVKGDAGDPPRKHLAKPHHCAACGGADEEIREGAKQPEEQAECAGNYRPEEGGIVLPEQIGDEHEQRPRVQVHHPPQAKAVERVEELTEIPKYQKKPPQD